MNMRAAEAAAAELSGLEGEERERQQRRVNELLRAANRQQAAKAAARTSENLHSAASSLRPKEGSVTSSQKNKQLQTYDPVLAGKQVAGGPGPNIAQGSRGGAPNVSIGQCARSAGAPQPRPQPQYQQPRPQQQYQQPQHQAEQQPRP